MRLDSDKLQEDLGLDNLGEGVDLDNWVEEDDMGLDWRRGDVGFHLSKEEQEQVVLRGLPSSLQVGEEELVVVAAAQKYFAWQQGKTCLQLNTKQCKL